MSLDDHIRQAGEALSQRLRDGIEAEVRGFLAELVAAAAEQRATVASEERRAAEAEAAKTLAAQVAQVRAEAEQTLSARLSEARADAEKTLTAKVGELREQSEETLAARLAVAQAEAEDRLSSEIANVRAQAEQASPASFARLLGAVRRVDEAQSLSQVLDALTDCAGAEASRVAVLIVHGPRLRGWRFAGFGPEAGEARSVDLGLAEAGVVGRAVEHAETCTLQAGPTGAPPGSELRFAALPAHRNALAVPVRVGGQVMAVVYADDVSDTDRPGSAVWSEAIEILARHAGPSLERLTAVRAAQVAALSNPPAAATPPAGADRGQPADDSEDGARRYARILLSEIKLYNEAAVRAGRQAHDLFDRLRPEIERARSLYEERISPKLRARNLYFDQELVRTLANGDPSLLGG